MKCSNTNWKAETRHKLTFVVWRGTLKKFSSNCLLT